MALFITPEVFGKLFQCSDEDPYQYQIIRGKRSYAAYSSLKQSCDVVVSCPHERMIFSGGNVWAIYGVSGCSLVVRGLG